MTKVSNGIYFKFVAAAAVAIPDATCISSIGILLYFLPTPFADLPKSMENTPSPSVSQA